MPHLLSVELTWSSLACCPPVCSAAEEWPLSTNAHHFEPAPEPDAPFDFLKEADTFYMETEGTGSVEVLDVVERVRYFQLYLRPSPARRPIQRF